MTRCTLCDALFQVPSKYKAFPICPPCYDSAFDLDMKVTRKLKWEEPSEIMDGLLWLGGEGSTLDRDWLLQHGIRRILTVATHMERMTHHEGIQYQQIDVDDDPSEDLKQHWKSAFEFLDQAKNDNSGILVHCVSGISRSGATVVAYVMHSQGIQYDEALARVRRRRPCVSPNGGFQDQLRAFEKTLKLQVPGSTNRPS
ncbi:MAP kinase phosphatase with leucine-rich repeats protein [Seminavis robusta]|uniref:protein-tyrosine-phosphatase n=1 Tax=Seminavis robusta TaxID=568900 RepID=A0A9N8DXR6_9STRA|nr:MAP kinase phosphatase with leucine-rich repeats protein [Seminavis robusta]|eukprot:Sro352_g124200.1 MAP kinase phosphatase with leucine-rich repeats protein (199) ;mRNA; r:30605-31201